MTIAEQIKDALISQKKLAKLIGVTDVDFTRKMKRNDFTASEIKKMQTALRIVLYEY